MNDASIQILCTAFERAVKLSSIEIAGCGLKQMAIESFCNSFISNNFSELKLNLSNNPFTVHCIQALFSPLQRSWMIHTLDLSGCKINDSVCQTLCAALQSVQNCTLQRLVLNDAKLDSILLSQRTAQLVADGMGKMLDHCSSIRSLSLVRGYSVNILLLLFKSLEKNQSLVDLDVSENKLGDSGASSLAELIRQNNSLASIVCDGNNFTLQGFYSLGLAAKQSSTLQRFDIPWNDLTQNMASNKGNCSLPGSLLMKLYLQLHANRINSVYCEFIEQSERNPIAMVPVPPSIVPQPMVDQLEEWELAALNEISAKTANTKCTLFSNPFYKERGDDEMELPPAYPIESESNDSRIFLEKVYSDYSSEDDNDKSVLEITYPDL